MALVFVWKNNETIVPVMTSSGYIVDLEELDEWETNVEDLAKLPKEHLIELASRNDGDGIVRNEKIDKTRRKMNRQELATYIMSNFEGIIQKTTEAKAMFSQVHKVSEVFDQLLCPSDDEAKDNEAGKSSGEMPDTQGDNEAGADSADDKASVKSNESSDADSVDAPVHLSKSSGETVGMVNITFKNDETGKVAQYVFFFSKFDQFRNIYQILWERTRIEVGDEGCQSRLKSRDRNSMAIGYESITSWNENHMNLSIVLAGPLAGGKRAKAQDEKSADGSMTLRELKQTIKAGVLQMQSGIEKYPHLRGISDRVNFVLQQSEQNPPNVASELMKRLHVIKLQTLLKGTRGAGTRVSTRSRSFVSRCLLIWWQIWEL